MAPRRDDQLSKDFLPERILFLIDSDAEGNLQDFVRGTGPTRLEMVKQAICNFVCAKKVLSPLHEFALGTLSDRADVLQPYTEDISLLLKTLDNFSATVSYNSFDLSSVFELQGHRRTCTYRTILIYFRSNVIPKYCSAPIETPGNYYFDAVYIHEPPSDDNEVQVIYDTIQHAEKKNGSYIFEVSENAKKFYFSFGQLLANPAQRPQQDEITNEY